mmetsp:Transcript_44092/g.58523  ORF Transcript_44092/g.58523 Transcript_44092/m.58523 type:complete len:80 (-) Transcript_44092:2004-2243(-)
MALSNKWWERHLRGFEAQLPPQLMQNLYRIFNEVVLSRDLDALNTTHVTQSGDEDLAPVDSSQVIAALDAQEKGAHDED